MFKRRPDSSKLVRMPNGFVEGRFTLLSHLVENVGLISGIMHHDLEFAALHKLFEFLVRNAGLLLKYAQNLK